jgi:shikimate dehydrogenase
MFRSMRPKAPVEGQVFYWMNSRSRFTYSLGLIGFPLQQSLSPRLHNAALEQMGLPGEFRLYPIPPLPEGETLLRETIARVRLGRIQGLNVTIPHKQAVLPYLEQLTPQAQAIGAVNTIFCRNGVLTGDNTDAPGFISDLRRRLVEMNRLSESTDESRGSRIALVLGAGGAARAVAYALWQAGWQVTVAARRLEQAGALVASLQQSAVASNLTPASLTSSSLLSSQLNEFISYHQERQSITADPKLKILVNASSAGMLPDIASCPWPEELPFPEGWLVYDLVYKPPETTLLRRARAAGLTAVNGLGMLVEQAALALELWTGQPVPRQAMWDAAGQSIERGIK